MGAATQAEASNAFGKPPELKQREFRGGGYRDWVHLPYYMHWPQLYTAHLQPVQSLGALTNTIRPSARPLLAYAVGVERSVMFFLGGGGA